MNKLFKDEPVVLVDAFAWIFRSYYALPDFRNSRGEPTGAVYGFLSTLVKLSDFAAHTSGAPAEMAVFFDKGGPQERLAAYAEYKANRPETPPDLRAQVPMIEEALAAMNLPMVAENGVEADDSIASVALQLAKEDRTVFIASSDKDFFQLLSDRIRLLRAGGRGEDFLIYDRSALKEKFGLAPEAMVEYYALVGDAVDNVPGVRGIGEKTAAKLLQKFPTLDDIYENLGKLPKATVKSLSAQKAEAYLSRDLVRLRKDLDIDVTPKQIDPSEFDGSRLQDLLERLDLHRLSERLLSLGGV